MLKQIQKGFTLIELMIVIAIIGILAAIAIPAYQDYVIRSQVTEGLTLASSVKAAVSEFYADRGEWPTDDGGGSGQLGFTAPPSGKYVTGIDVTDGTMTVTYGNNANPAIAGKFLSLKPLVSLNDDVVWQCGYNTVNTSIANEASAESSGADSTDLAGKYLPSNCRAP
jgi:type IV pilus assembly protein PilA